MTRQRLTRHSVDTDMDMLADRHRRRLLVSLLGQESTPVHVEDIVQSTGDGDSVETRMHHIHLPKLADEEYIVWERATGAVWQGPQFDTLRPILESLCRLADEPHGDARSSRLGR